MAHKIDAEKCVACGCCKDACPAEAITEGTPFAIDADKCVDCGRCAEVCPSQAREIAGTEMTVREVLEQEPSYYTWMQNGDFTQDTKNVLTKIYLEGKNTK